MGLSKPIFEEEGCTLHREPSLQGLTALRGIGVSFAQGAD
ncbi:hypothetical protein ATPR_2940 [Acetobacter tropicalis NBRC 101654]|uniref:Uncharacterized protein n=1 Tax=Acetobacter tropicalis NBRC 101654 TaxID=749388 RepID=F7VHU1_9PROT|nr:hypothetical protein ATPR_2940 [Acetobacter tropicalis NBRC 101654]